MRDSVRERQPAKLVKQHIGSTLRREKPRRDMPQLLVPTVMFEADCYCGDAWKKMMRQKVWQ